MKVTVYYCEGAYTVYMCFHFLALRTYTTFIWAGHWVALAHLPVVVDHVFIHRAIVLAVFTAERTLGAGLALVNIHTPTLKVLVTVGTRNCSKLTANKPLVQFLV